MKFPYVNNIKEGKEMATSFSGYNHTNKCVDGQFYDMNNLECDKYPFLGVRAIKKYYQIGAKAADKNSFSFISANGKLFCDGEQIAEGFTESWERQIVRMGDYVCVFPDYKYVNVNEPGTIINMEVNKQTVVNNAPVYNNQGTLSGYEGLEIYQVDSNRKEIKPHTVSYYESHKPEDGAYRTDTQNGSVSLSVYSESTGMWTPITGTYVRIRVLNRTTKEFEEINDGDAIEISLDLNDFTTAAGGSFRTNSNGEIEDNAYDALKALFVNEEDDDTNLSNNFVVKINTHKSLYIPGIIPRSTYGSAFTESDNTYRFLFPNAKITVKRKLPSIDHVVECQNRLWATDTEGREIYACALGNPSNWNRFSGISTDSYAATIGSDGVFTGAISYKGYPLLFKQDSVIRVSVSSQGAHQIKEIRVNGVQNGSHKSLVEINGLVYYKSPSGVCVFDGNNSSLISDSLGAVTYTEAVGGTINEKYYIEMKGPNGAERFVYDTKTGMWTKEDAHGAKCFIKIDYYESNNASHVNELYACNNQTMEVVCGNNTALELDVDDELVTYNVVEGGKVDWFVESGTYGFTTKVKGFSQELTKNLSRINVRMRLESDSNVSFQIKYDSYGDFQTVWQMYGRGTKTFTIPMKPHRCDHYKYRIVGRGNAEIISITRTYTEGSDM